MKQKLLVAFLSFATFAGFSSGAASLVRQHHARQVAMEQHVADVCTEAALRAQRHRSVELGQYSY